MFFKNYYKSLISLLLIFILCFLPGNTIDNSNFSDIPGFDKLVHFGMYFLFSFFLLKDLKNNLKFLKIQLLLIIFSFTFVMGGSIEIIQDFFIPGRSGNLYDLSADLGGTAFFVLIFFKKI